MNIKAILFAIILAISNGGINAQSQPTATECDQTVIVVGAGVAGLSAAKQLKAKGFTVIVLEAQDRTGGRLKTDYSLGFAFDEGASWIHGPTNNPITVLANDAGLTTYLTDDENTSIFNAAGTEYPSSITDSAYTAYEDLLAEVIENGDQESSVKKITLQLNPQFESDPLLKYMLSAYLEFSSGGDIDSLSSLDFRDDEAFAGSDLIITNGYDKLTDFLAEGLDIRLSHSVTQIDYSSSTVVVTANSTSFEADYVLCTVPLGVLKKNIISFNPILPSGKTEAIAGTQMGQVNKFLLVFDSTFWDNSLQYIGYTPDTKGKYNYFMNINKFAAQSNALMTFAFGNFSELTENQSDTEVIAEIMIHLKAIYGNSIPDPTSFKRTKWKSDPYTFGSYSYATNERRSSDFDSLAESVSDRLFFAGEHTIKDYRGTVHGAHLSGMSAAQEISELCSQTTGQYEQKIDEIIKVYVDHKSQKIYFSYDESINGLALVSLMDTQGKQVVNQYCRNSIDISNITSGLYVLNVSIDNKQYQAKLYCK
jgi:monoamine oxidase